MYGAHLRFLIAFISVTFVAAGCASVNYVGKSFDPTTSVAVYFDESEIDREYVVFGQAIGSGVWRSYDTVQEKLIEEAMRKGADAILVTGIGRSHVPIGGSGQANENQINAAFIKYK